MTKSKILELCMDVRNGKSSVEGVSLAERKKDLVEVFSKLLENYEGNKTEINAILTENSVYDVDAIIILKAAITKEIIENDFNIAYHFLI